MAKIREVGKFVSYETWCNRELGTGCYSQSDTEEQARVIAAEFEADGHPNIEILKITTGIEVINDV